MYGAYKKRNTIPFTRRQVDAIYSGLQEGLTVIIGPPGTGKTDVAVQILSELYHNQPKERILIVTHSNHALNDIFGKLLVRDVDPRYCLRLGSDQDALTDLMMHHQDTMVSDLTQVNLLNSNVKGYEKVDFSQRGRVNHMLQTRLVILQEVKQIATCLRAVGDVSDSVETAVIFYKRHLLPLYTAFEAYLDSIKDTLDTVTVGDILAQYPFTKLLDTAAVNKLKTAKAAKRLCKSYWARIQLLMKYLSETQCLEVLRSFQNRSEVILTKHARIVAMTCTYASIKYSDFCKLALQYDTVIVEEAGQVTDLELFLPLCIEQNKSVHSSVLQNRLKRCILLGDHNQLPPIIQSQALVKYSNLDMSLFSRLIALQVPYIQLNAQGRMRPQLAALWNWRYNEITNLDVSKRDPRFLYGNCGLVYEYQFINVLEWGGESIPQPHYIQNVGEAEYVVYTYMYMRCMGIPNDRITILTTYNGQKCLIEEVLQIKLGKLAKYFKYPKTVSTVDKYQGQQNDYVLLSLVRTKSLGYLRDIRRFIVAMSRARLGLYVFGYKDLFVECFELGHIMMQLLSRPTTLSICPEERSPDGTTTRKELTPLVDFPSQIHTILDLQHMSIFIQNMTRVIETELAHTQTYTTSTSTSSSSSSSSTSANKHTVYVPDPTIDPTMLETLQKHEEMHDLETQKYEAELQLANLQQEQE